METVLLFRPVNQKELDLIKQSDWKAFPARLPEQPFFYPVLNIEYAEQINQWNVGQYGSGHIVKFLVKKEFLDEFIVQTVGSFLHQEYWIPSADLEEFNNNIIGKIELI